MSKTVTIKIPEELRDEIQRYDLERSSRRDIIAYILSHDDLDITSQRLQQYQKEYDDKFMLFEKAKFKLESEYIRPISEGKTFNWTLNYSTCIVTIIIND